MTWQAIAALGTIGGVSLAAIGALVYALAQVRTFARGQMAAVRAQATAERERDQERLGRITAETRAEQAEHKVATSAAALAALEKERSDVDVKRVETSDPTDLPAVIDDLLSTRL